MTTLSFRTFLFTLAFAPLAFATVEHWSMLTVEILSSLTLIFLLAGLRQKEQPLLQLPGIVPLLLLLAYMLIPLIPLPPGIVKFISPAAWEVYKPIYEQGGMEWLPMSVNQKATLQEFFRISAYVVFYIATVQILRSGKKVKTTVKFVAFLAIFIAIIAILQQFTSEGNIYWIRPAPKGEPGGPWVNINQYASYIAAMSPIVLGLFLFYRPRAHEGAQLREQVVVFFSSPNNNVCMMLGAGFVLMLFSVFISLSRGGIISLVLSIFLFALLLSYRRRSFGNMALWVCLCLPLLAVTWFGWEQVIDKFGTTFDEEGLLTEGRLTVWSDIFMIIKDFPVFGAGFGTFNDLYPSYQTILPDFVFEHAHNDYLELFTDGGIIGFGLAGWFCFTVLSHGWKNIWQRGDRFAVLLGISCFTSICALLIHSIFDFNLHNGAVGLYFFFLCGLMIASVNGQYNTHRPESRLGEMRGRVGIWLGLATALLLIATTIVQVGVLRARAAYFSVKDIYISSHLSPNIAQNIQNVVRTASKHDPLEGLYSYYIGNLSFLENNHKEAMHQYIQAARKQPLNGIYLQRIGMLLPGDSDESHELMLEGYRRARNKEDVAYDWAEWLVMKDRREMALQVLEERLNSAHYRASKVAPILEAHRFSREDITSVMPEEVEPWIQFGMYMERIGNFEEAGYYFQHAATLLNSEYEPKANWFAELIVHYRRLGQFDRSLSLLRQATEKIPDEPLFHLWLGDHYYKENITYRARQEYEQAVMLAPDNEKYRKKLQRLEQEMGVSN